MNLEFLKEDFYHCLENHKINYRSYNLITLLGLVRTLTEYDEIGNHWPVLRMYCNWGLHKELEGNDSSKSFIFDSVARIMYDLWEEKDKMVNDICESLGFEKFGSELENFVKTISNSDKSLPNNFLNTDFYGAIAYLLAHRPLVNKEEFKNGISKGRRYGKLSIVDKNNKNVYISKLEITKNETNDNALLAIYLDPPPPKHNPKHKGVFMYVTIVNHLDKK